MGTVKKLIVGALMLLAAIPSFAARPYPYPPAPGDDNVAASMTANLDALASYTDQSVATHSSLTTVAHGLSASNTTGHQHAKIYYQDTRSTNHAGFDYTGITLHLKSNTTDSLADGGTYHHTLHLAGWNDASGGEAHQLAFTDNDNIWLRNYASSAWGSWYKLWHAGNDGSGSTLDADKLDTKDSTDFVASSTFAAHENLAGPSVHGAATSGTNTILVTNGSGYLDHRNWVCVGNSTGLYTPGGSYLYNNSSASNGGWFCRSPSGAGAVSFQLQTGDGVVRGWYYANSSGYSGLLNAGGTWRLQVPNSGTLLRDGSYSIWDSGNDGSGSTLDSDKLDGNDSTYFAAASTLTAHTGNTSNPHSVTAAQAGALGATAKAADSDKLDGNDSTYFAAASALTAHTGNTSNPHSVTAAQAGALGATAKAADSDKLDGNDSTNFLNTTSGAQTKAGPLTVDGGSVQPMTLKTSSSGPWALSLARSDLSLESKVYNSNGRCWYFQHRPSFAGNTPWDSGNDGAGSGLAADTVDGVHASSTYNLANSIPIRDASGYLYLGWINTTSGDNGTTTPTRIYASNDGFIRYYTPANFITAMGLCSDSELTTHAGLTGTSAHGAATAGTANAIAARDANGDITTRLFKSTYAEQTSAPAATADIAFRNDTSDNYIRFMSAAAFKQWLINSACGVAQTSAPASPVNGDIWLQ